MIRELGFREAGKHLPNIGEGLGSRPILDDELFGNLFAQVVVGGKKLREIWLYAADHTFLHKY